MMPIQILNKPIIAIDIDDVLAENARGFVEWSNKRFGTSLTIDDYNEHWGQVWKVNNQEVDKRSDEYHESNYIGNYGTIPNAKQALEILKTKFTLILITSRVATMKNLTKEWIEKIIQISLVIMFFVVFMMVLCPVV